MKKNLSKKRSAFSLIELSIVLIIIGLLIAGVTGGASLIKSSELRSVITEARGWAIAVNSFYNQFDALPGDYSTALGGSEVGDADGTIEYYNTDTIAEGRNAWVQLKAAAILDSNVLSAATSVASLGTQVTFGTNIPASKIKSSGWDFDYNATSLQNVVVLSGTIATGTTYSLVPAVESNSYATGAVTPIDALSIDSKFDDGDAEEGKIRGVKTACHTTSTYTTATTTKACALSYQVDVNS